MRIQLFLAAFICLFCDNAGFGQTPLWRQTAGPIGGYVTGLNFDSAGGACVLSGYAFRSTDDGLSWMELPVTPSDLHTLPNGHLVAFVSNTIGVSADYGQTWHTIVSNPKYSSDPGYIAVTTAGEIYVEKSNAILRTTDEGLSWDTLPSGPITGRLFAFNTPTLFLLSVRMGGDVMYRSTDRGVTWSKVINGLVVYGLDGDALAGGPNGVMIYKSFWGFYISTDDGRTWQAHSDQGSKGSTLVVTAQDDIGISALSEDAGPGPYIQIYNRTGILTKTLLGGLGDGYGADSKILAVSPSGEFWLADGALIGKFDPASSQTAFITTIGPPTGTVSSIIAMAEGDVIANSGGGYKTTDGGSNWYALNGTPSLSPSVFDSSHALLACSSGAIVQSKDSGVTWKQLGSTLTSTPITSLVVDPMGTIYAGSGEGVFRTTDGGKSWDQLNTGLKTTSILSLTVNGNGEVFAGTTSSIFHSTDRALSWHPLPFVPPDSSGITSLVVNTSEDILAAVKDSGIYWSHDDGLTWSPLGAGLKGKVHAFLSTPIGHVFAATDQGVFYLSSGGGTWVDADTGIGKVNVLSITRDQAGTVYLGTQGDGVFKSTQSYNIIKPAGVTSAKKISNEFSLGWVYPNPVSNSFTFEFKIPTTLNVKVELVNALGQEVRSLAAAEFTGGTHSLSLSTIGLAQGVYQLQLLSGTEERTHRVVVLKGTR